MKDRFIFSIVIVTLLLITIGCKKEDSAKKDTLRFLYEGFKDGRISECRHKGQTVYSASINAYDVGSTIFDKDGNGLGGCSYGWIVKIDEICTQLTDCETIYMVQNNIWGQPPVDKYGLSRK